MKTNEAEKLRRYSNEKELRELAEEIGDRITFKGYSREQVVELVTELMTIDLLSLEYATREDILNVLCDSVLYYDIRNEINFVKLSSIKDYVEPDLKEYIKEIIG